MAVELIVTEVFKRGNALFRVGDVIRDPQSDIWQWAVKNRPTHVMRKAARDPAPASVAAAPVPEEVTDAPARRASR